MKSAALDNYSLRSLRLDGVLEVDRDPASGPPRPGRGYRSLETLGRDASIEPVAAPGRRIAIADLIP